MRKQTSLLVLAPLVALAAAGTTLRRDNPGAWGSVHSAQSDMG